MRAILEPVDEVPPVAAAELIADLTERFPLLARPARPGRAHVPERPDARVLPHRRYVIAYRVLVGGGIKVRRVFHDAPGPDPGG